MHPWEVPTESPRNRTRNSYFFPERGVWEQWCTPSVGGIWIWWGLGLWAFLQAFGWETWRSWGGMIDGWFSLHWESKWGLKTMNKPLWNSKFPPNAFIFSICYKWAGSRLVLFLHCWKAEGSLHTTHHSDKQCSHEPIAIYRSNPISHIFASRLLSKGTFTALMDLSTFRH